MVAGQLGRVGLIDRRCETTSVGRTGADCRNEVHTSVDGTEAREEKHHKLIAMDWDPPN
jgi:hypothetical protein